MQEEKQSFIGHVKDLWLELKIAQVFVKALAAGDIANGLGTFAHFYLVLLLTKERGYSDTLAGWMALITAVGSVFNTAWLSRRTDKFDRKTVMIISMFIAGVSTIMMGYLSPWWGVGLIAFVQGAATNAYSVASRAYLNDQIPGEDERSRVGQLLYWVYNVGLGCAPLIVQVSALFSSSYSALFAVDGGTTLLFMSIVYFYIPKRSSERAQQEQREQKDQQEVSYEAAWKDPQLRTFVISGFIKDLVYAQYATILPLSMADHGLNKVLIGWVMAVNAAVVTGLGWKKMYKGMPTYRVLAWSSLGIGVGMFLPIFLSIGSLGQSTPAIMVIDGLALYIMTRYGEIVSEIGEERFKSERSKYHKNQSDFQGLARIHLYVGYGVGPFLGTVIYQYLGEGIVWGLCLLGGLGAAFGYLAMEHGFRGALLFLWRGAWDGIQAFWRGTLSTVKRKGLALGVFGFKDVLVLLVFLPIASSPMTHPVNTSPSTPKGVYQLPCGGAEAIELHVGSKAICFAGKGDLLLPKGQHWDVDRIDLPGNLPAWVSYSAGDALPRVYSQMSLQKGKNLVAASMGFAQMPINGVHLGTTLPLKYPAFTQGRWVHEVEGSECSSRTDFGSLVDPLLEKRCFANAGLIHLHGEQMMIAASSGDNRIQYMYQGREESYTEFDLDYNQSLTVPMILPEVPLVTITDVHIN